MTTLSATTLSSLVARGAWETFEFKRSTAEPPCGRETLCAFLNGGLSMRHGGVHDHTP